MYARIQKRAQKILAIIIIYYGVRRGVWWCVLRFVS
jgi:hypothetical protein